MINQAKPSRGRPRAFDREHALEAALLLFWEQGYEGTSISQLTSVMKITPPSLYAAFGSKEQLYQEVLKRYLSSHGDFITTGLAAKTNVRDRVAIILREAAVRFTRTNFPPGCLVANGALRCASEHQLAVEATAALRRSIEMVLNERIKAAIRAKELPVGTDALGLAGFFAAVVQGMSVQAIDGTSRKKLLKVADLAMSAWPVSARRSAG